MRYRYCTVCAEIQYVEYSEKPIHKIVGEGVGNRPLAVSQPALAISHPNLAKPELPNGVMPMNLDESDLAKWMLWGPCGQDMNDEVRHTVEDDIAILLMTDDLQVARVLTHFGGKLPQGTSFRLFLLLVRFWCPLDGAFKRPWSVQFPCLVTLC